MKQLRSELAAQNDQLAKYAAIQTDGDAIRAEVGGDIERLKQENSALMSTVKSFGTSVPASWLLVGVLLAFFGGAFGGWFWVDRQSRSRHGGYRVY